MKCPIFLCALMCAHAGYASNACEQDTLASKNLNEVVVTADQQYATAQKTSYIPSAQAKKSAQSGADLLRRMGIPQIQVDPLTNAIRSAAGSDVAVFIDYVPCNASQLEMMPVADAARVDYYDNPSDPRFQGKARVVNIILRKQDFGGYAKASAEAGTIVTNGAVKGLVRTQHRHMTYDVMGIYRHTADNHRGASSVEDFDTGELSFTRTSTLEKSKFRQGYGQLDLRALFDNGNAYADNLVSLGSNSTPHNDRAGTVAYRGIDRPATVFRSDADSKEQFMSYTGNYYVGLSDAFSLAGTLIYIHSKTKESSVYAEWEFDAIENRANDTSDDFTASMLASLDMNKAGRLDFSARTSFSDNRTRYAGSAVAYDKSDITLWQFGTAYSISRSKLQGRIGLGLSLLRSTLNDNRVSSVDPYADFFVRYAPSKKHAVSLEFHFSKWPPYANLKSDVRMQVSPYLWQTGNPDIRAYSSYDLGLFYNFLPSDMLSLTAYATMWANKDRYAYVYVPMPGSQGVLRTIQQPMGVYLNEQTGLSLRLRLLGDALAIAGRVEQTYTHNSSPYDYNLNRVTFGLDANWYAGNFDIGMSYRSPNRSSESNTYNTIVKTRDTYSLSAGWSNGPLNLRLSLNNMFRWDWKRRTSESRYEHYSNVSTDYSGEIHANIVISAAYTLNFGKKVSNSNESREQNLNSSGILHSCRCSYPGRHFAIRHVYDRIRIQRLFPDVFVN